MDKESTGKTVLLTEIRGPAAILTMNRPEKYNALNGALLCAIGDKVRELDGDGNVRGIVLTGADRYFSTGADLDDALQAQELSATHAMLECFDYCNRSIERSRLEDLGDAGVLELAQDLRLVLEAAQGSA